MVGIIPSSFSEKIIFNTDFSVPPNIDHSYTIYINNYTHSNRFSLYGDRKSGQHLINNVNKDINIPKQWQSGDRFKFVLNMDNSECNIYFNDALLVANAFNFNKFDGCVTPAMAIWNCHVKFIEWIAVEK
eukprot:UN09284